jgi:ubiquinol-cytochrome c reductase iron-sulfur subunit
MRSFRALHAAEPIAGLHSSGKGANRTILDCLFRPIGWDNGRSAAAGVAGAGGLFRLHAYRVIGSGSTGRG